MVYDCDGGRTLFPGYSTRANESQRLGINSSSKYIANPAISYYVLFRINEPLIFFPVMVAVVMA